MVARNSDSSPFQEGKADTIVIAGSAAICTLSGAFAFYIFVGSVFLREHTFAISEMLWVIFCIVFLRSLGDGSRYVRLLGLIFATLLLAVVLKMTASLGIDIRRYFTFALPGLAFCLFSFWYFAFTTRANHQTVIKGEVWGFVKPFAIGFSMMYGIVIIGLALR
jgi:hypothetical protein